MIYAILAPDYDFFCLSSTTYALQLVFRAAHCCFMPLYYSGPIEHLHNREHNREDILKSVTGFFKRSNFDILKRKKLQRKQINMIILIILLLFYRKRIFADIISNIEKSFKCLVIIKYFLIRLMEKYIHEYIWLAQIFISL